ncbi:MAG: DUF4097 family beta strand repeat-containing protein [Thermoanaerobaculia bacterium]
MRNALMIAVVALFAAAASAVTLQETFDRTFDVRPGALVLLSNVNGKITIHSSNEPRVVVHAEKRVESRDSDAARHAMTEMTIEATPTDGGVRIVTHEPRSAEGGFWSFLLGDNVNTSVTYDVIVPRTMDLDISDVNGMIAATEVSGKLRLETTNGKIDLARCSGTVDASTTNGGIRAELVQVTAGRELNFETTNGRITLIVPQSLAADIDAGTTNGSITTDLAVTTKSFDSNTLRGAVNGGGPKVRLRTTNGGIEIRTTGNQAASR